MSQGEKYIKPNIILPLIVFATIFFSFFARNNDNSIDWNTTVVFGTALILLWSTFETYILRLEAQKNREYDQTPILLLGLTEDMDSLSLEIKNDSDVVAFDIEFYPWSVGEDSGFDVADFAHKLYIDSSNQYVRSRTSVILKVISLKKPDGKITRHNFKLNDLMHIMSIDQKSIALLLHYKNAIGEKYYLIYKLYSITTIKPALQFIESGKGCLSYNEALEITRNKDPQLHPQYSLLKYLGREIAEPSSLSK